MRRLAVRYAPLIGTCAIVAAMATIDFVIEVLAVASESTADANPLATRRKLQAAGCAVQLGPAPCQEKSLFEEVLIFLIFTCIVVVGF